MTTALDGPVSVTYLCEEVSFTRNVTQNMETYLVGAQALGKRLITWQHMGSNAYWLYFQKEIVLAGKNGETLPMHKVRSLLQNENVHIAPWQVYYFPSNAVVENVWVPKGVRSPIIRLSSEYTDVLQVGDPVELVNIETCQPFGRGIIVSLKKALIRELTFKDMHMTAKLGGLRIVTPETFRKFLSEHYEGPVSLDDVVSVVTIKTTEPSGLGKPNFLERLHGLVAKHWTTKDEDE
jgi:hypothetical protein